MDQQQQIAQGSLKSSHRNTHAIVLKKANYNVQKKAIDYLTNELQDLVICQRLNSVDLNNKIGSLFTKATFFVHSTNIKSEPGFLVFLDGITPTYIRYNLSKKEREYSKGQPLCFSLRMRVSQEIYKGSIFIVTMDVVNHNMFIEDVYVYKGKNIFNSETFTERRKHMKDFAQYHWIPDVRLLGGIMAEITTPNPLSSLESFIDTQDYTKIFLIPDTPGKRRFTFTLNENIAKIENGYYGRKVETTKTPNTKPTYAKAVRQPLLPDVYELFDVDNKSLGKACVQQLELSRKLKELSGDILVNISYNEDFKRYEISSIY
jgi:hypothetical protein